MKSFEVGVLLLVLVLPGCKSGGSGAGDGNIQVVATVGMVADLVRNVGGEHVTVTQICGSGVDPHLYKPTSDDVHAIIDADVVFYCGLRLEGKMSDTLEKVGRTKPVVAVAEGIDPSKLMSAGVGGQAALEHGDPHVWNDISMWSQCVDVIRDELSTFDPQHAEEYQANAAALSDQLAALHRWGVETVATIPAESRLLVTSHDAFNYFGRAYGLEVQGVQGISTESEAGLQRINGLVDLLIERHVGAVFIESSVSAKNIEALIEGAQSKGHSVAIGGELYSDAMGPSGTYEGTYIGMLDHNLTTAALALGGQVDAGGFQGKLRTEAKH
ncbi:zinc ABC transporter substrate-binding protein [Stieleria sp. TO1_6]|uniref:metal ABC transporter solute-binding protein, Zn/Mn family n=1 Tax=Stieleria tagensis TaxID=2956795 RepID=UPI00209B1040|nr:zinc ABC transporter substrate-binding protein [Stieleria tagensis]MCO8124589.1 zinc ABC transporter substrate-binding protein [Stieleria tagensis]